LSKIKKPQYTFVLKENYLTTIRYSENSDLFLHCFVKNENGEILDVCQRGMFSCAVFVSNTLSRFNLIETPTANIDTLMKELEKCGWKFTNNLKLLKPGVILVWEAQKKSDGKMHKHVGFYLYGQQAISTRSPSGVPKIHHFQYNGDRKIVAIYTHPFLRE